MTAEADTSSDDRAAIAARPAPAPEGDGAGRLVVALFALLVVTALEVGVVGLPIDRAARITALVGLAMTKGLLLLAVFMRIGRESRIARAAIGVPLVLAPGFAVALMLDAAIRALQR